MPKLYVLALFVLFQLKWLNLPKTLVLVIFAYFYAEIICFSTFCIISKSKWLNLLKILVSVKFAEIIFWHFSDSFIKLFSLLQIPMSIVLSSEQKTISVTKYTGYVHKLIPEDEEKTSDFFQIILTHNGSTHYVPCLL